MASENTLTEEEVAFAEILGDLVEQWGFNRHLGRIWSLLYLRTNPLSPSLIQEALALSAGSVNSALAELQTWGVIKRIRIAGDRNFYYEPELRLWKSVSNVLRSRELRILEEARSGLTALGTSLQRRSKEKQADFQSKRVKHVRDALDIAFTLISFLVNGGGLTDMHKMNRAFERLRTM